MTAIRPQIVAAARSVEWGFNIALAVMLATALAAIAWIVSGIHVGWLAWAAWLLGCMAGASAADVGLGLRGKA